MAVASLQTAQYRLAQHYLDKLRATNAAYKRGNESVTYALNTFEQEWPQIRHWQTWLQGRVQHDNEARRLCSTYMEVGVDLLSLRQDPQEHLKWLETALAAARQMGDIHAEVQHLLAIGETYEELSAYDLAMNHLQQALNLAHQINDHSSLPILLDRQATVMMAQGDYKSAQRLCEEGLAVSRELGDSLNISRALGGLGNVAAYQGALVEAQAYYEQALGYNRTIGNQVSIAGNLYNLGVCNIDLGNYIHAQAYLEQSLILYRALGFKRGIAKCLKTLGSNALYEGSLRSAQALLQQANQTFLEIGDLQGVGDSLDSLGQVAYQQKIYAAAQDYFERSLAICHEIGDPRNVAVSLANVGMVAMALENYQRARDCLEQAAGFVREAGADFVLAQIHSELSRVYSRLGQPIQASQALREGLALAFKIDNDYLKIVALVSSVEMWQRVGKEKEAAAIASLAFHHPAAAQENRDVIQTLRPQLEAALSPQDLETAWEGGKTLDLNTVVTDILYELSS